MHRIGLWGDREWDAAAGWEEERARGRNHPVRGNLEKASQGWSVFLRFPGAAGPVGTGLPPAPLPIVLMQMMELNALLAAVFVFIVMALSALFVLGRGPASKQHRAGPVAEGAATPAAAPVPAASPVSTPAVSGVVTGAGAAGAGAAVGKGRVGGAGAASGRSRVPARAPGSPLVIKVLYGSTMGRAKGELHAGGRGALCRAQECVRLCVWVWVGGSGGCAPRGGALGGEARTAAVVKSALTVVPRPLIAASAVCLLVQLAGPAVFHPLLVPRLARGHRAPRCVWPVTFIWSRSDTHALSRPAPSRPRPLLAQPLPRKCLRRW
jgi:hypothetical protein